MEKCCKSKTCKQQKGYLKWTSKPSYICKTKYLAMI